MVDEPDPAELAALEDHEASWRAVAPERREARRQAALVASYAREDARRKAAEDERIRAANAAYEKQQAERAVDPATCDLIRCGKLGIADDFVRAHWPACLGDGATKLGADRWRVPFGGSFVVMRLDGKRIEAKPFGALKLETLYAEITQRAIELNSLAREASRRALIESMRFEVDTAPPSYLVDKLIGAGMITLLVGKKGKGKSTVAESIVQSVVLGRPWLGRPVKQCSVICVQLEMNEPLEKMFSDKIARGQGIDPRDLIDKRLKYKYRLRLDDRESVAQFEHIIAESEPGLVVIDSLFRAANASSENDNAIMGALMDVLVRLKEDHGVAFLVLVHANADGQVRGATAIAAACDNELLLDRASSKLDATITIRPDKQRLRCDPVRMRFADRVADDAMVPELVVENAKRPTIAAAVRDLATYVRDHGPIGINALAEAGEFGTNKTKIGELLRDAEAAGLVEQDERKKWRAVATTEDD